MNDDGDDGGDDGDDDGDDGGDDGDGDDGYELGEADQLVRWVCWFDQILKAN